MVYIINTWFWPLNLQRYKIKSIIISTYGKNIQKPLSDWQKWTKTNTSMQKETTETPINKDIPVISQYSILPRTEYHLCVAKTLLQNNLLYLWRIVMVLVSLHKEVPVSIHSILEKLPKIHDNPKNCSIFAQSTMTIMGGRHNIGVHSKSSFL